VDGEQIFGSPVWRDPREQKMKTPGDVAEILRLKAYGWGSKRIGWAMGYSHRTVGHCVLVGGACQAK
jgi:hypothetical protein